MEILLNKNYTIVQADNDISVFEEQEWDYLHPMLKIVENAYRKLGYDSDYAYSLYSNEYMHATYFMRDLGYDTDSFEIWAMNGLEFYEYLYKQCCDKHSISLHVFKNDVLEQKDQLQKCCEIIEKRN
jgi:hypothetical protein